MAAGKKKAKAPKKAVKRAKAKKAPVKKAKAPARKTKTAKKSSARKAAAGKPVQAKKKAPAKKKKQTVGEGDYEASRAFLKDQAGFVKENKARIPELGRQARAALEGSEGPALLSAEAEARGHSKNENT